MSSWNEERISEMMEHYQAYGKEETLKAYEIKEETFNRYKRDYLTREEIKEDAEYIQQIKQRYTEHELKQIAKGGFYNEPQKKEISFDGETIKIGLFGDTHIGSKYLDINKLNACIEVLNTCDQVVHVGDITEGMSNRAGHIYELSEIGYEAQKNKAIELLSKIKVPVSAISGNHDLWFKMSNGAEIVPEICKALNWSFMGDHQGDIFINGCHIMLWHGNDGSSYAHSYRPQKIVENFQGGKKPNVLLTGHVHKAIQFFERNVHVVSAGCIQDQTPFMMGKRLAAHTGFWTLEITIADGQVKKIAPLFYPFYY